MNAKQKEVYSEIEKLIDEESFLESIKQGFQQLHDPRNAKKNLVYQFTHLLVIILCAIISGANTITDIHAYATAKEALFKQIFAIEKAPSYSVFWWIMTRMDPKGLQDGLVEWIQSLPSEMAQKIIAIDGKRLRGAARNQQIHLVSAWDSLRSLLLGQVKTAEKSNEITAIPELLDSLDLHGAIVTIDAAGCQKEIAKRICTRGGDYVIALKGNQGTLLAEAENFFQQASEVGYEDAGCETSAIVEKGHGRIEERVVVVTNRLDWLDSRQDWEGLTSMIELTSRRTGKGKTTEEKRYFISSKSLSTKKAAEVIRSHWAIENHLHWSMDVNFCEDDCLVSVGNAAENFAMFRRIVATLFRNKLGGIRGTASLRRQAKWNDNAMLDVFSGIFSVDKT
jgi:predicted transposase YbfD/YdcC